MLMRLLPEFQESGNGPQRLLISIQGEQFCLDALYSELLEIGAEEPFMEGGRFFFFAPAAADADLFLSRVAAIIERGNSRSGGPAGAAVSETRMVPARPRSSGDPIRLGAHFRVLQAGAAGPIGDDVILLAASSVFGSGLHPSTRLAVRAMDDLFRQQAGFPEAVLDVGTGSGLLAMVAARLGAEMVVGIDISEEAVKAAGSNLALNGLQDRIMVTATPLALVPGRFALILANLAVSVQLRLAADLEARLEPGGDLIVSGMQGSRQEIATLWQKRNFRPVAAYEEDGWRALRLRGE